MPALFITLLLLLSQVLLSQASYAQQVLRVGIASSFSPAVASLQSAFSAEHRPDITLSRASSGKLYAQALHGAPFDLIIFADSKYSLMLMQQRQPAPLTTALLASGEIGLLGRDNECDLFEKQIQPQTTLAIANPKTAPYGRAAKQLLDTLPAEQTAKLTVVTAENAVQALHFFATGNADYVITSSALITQWIKQQVNPQLHTCPIPQSDYDALHYHAVLLTTKAKPLLEFMQTAASKAQLNSLGYTTVDD